MRRVGDPRRWLVALSVLGACAAGAAACGRPPAEHPPATAAGHPEAAPGVASPAVGAAGAPDAAAGGATDGSSLTEAVDLLRAGRWQAAAAAATGGATPYGAAMEHYVRAAAAAGLQQVANADAELAAFEAARKAVPAGTRVSAANGAAEVLDVARLDLAARVAWLKGDVSAALLGWGRAAVVEDRLAPADPPDWRLPVRERLGAALLAMKNGAQAEGVFRAELERRPASARAMHGLAESLALEGRADEAARARAGFEAAWTGTGDPLPLGASARRP
ncbi:MAG: hypothetical protein AB7H88_15445 [Vicinamibacterales bacterium]